MEEKLFKPISLYKALIFSVREVILKRDLKKGY